MKQVPKIVACRYGYGFFRVCCWEGERVLGSMIFRAAYEGYAGFVGGSKGGVNSFVPFTKGHGHGYDVYAFGNGPFDCLLNGFLESEMKLLGMGARTS